MPRVATKKVSKPIEVVTSTPEPQASSSKLPSFAFRRLASKDISILRARLKHYQGNLAKIESGEIVPSLTGMVVRFSKRDVILSLKTGIRKLEKVIDFKKNSKDPVLKD